MCSTAHLHAAFRLVLTTLLLFLASGASAQLPGLITQRALAQQGLGLAFAQNAEQAHLGILANVLFENQGCAKLHFAGSVKVISNVLTGTTRRAVVHVFYDAACTSPYIKANLTLIEGAGNTYDITETATYLSEQGAQLGVLRLKVKATANQSAEVIGLGTFTPRGGSAAKIGLKCSIPLSSGAAVIRCTGGLAQDFRLVARAIASLATVNATVTEVGNSFRVTFRGPPSVIFTGPPGQLSVTLPTPSTLGIGGPKTRFGGAAPSGSAAEFAMFPPAPTSWTITDQGHDARFTISVVPGQQRRLAGTIKTISTNRTLATIAVDKTGTGTITYSNGAKAAITSWILGG